MRLLRILLGLCPAGFHVQPEQPITCPDSEPEPDLAIIRGTEEDYPKSHPATAGVKEVWLVLGLERRVDVFLQPEAGRYGISLTIAPEATLACATLPAVSFPVAELFPA